MAKDKNPEKDQPISTDEPVLNNLGGPNADEVTETNVVASTDTPTTSNQDAAINAAVSDKDQLQPGDDGYSANTDPVIPSSALAEVVAAELAGDGTSPTRDALVEAQKK